MLSKLFNVGTYYSFEEISEIYDREIGDKELSFVSGKLVFKDEFGIDKGKGKCEAFIFDTGSDDHTIFYILYREKNMIGIRPDYPLEYCKSFIEMLKCSSSN
ncbi:hypothetical protein [Clostridium cylindrosporum]|uniref:Uncharacterized protein n=1 Tax=Clostridium cylindrosporum DSM 605 TaxID=1121307 RepID=A0A0J8DF76_CLOCY|nr:hypothetical protein [Clostridium cylindrosporum]KMT22904.1 hypothetical protein CLCY_5c01430 [Clostridium cylindrosporum DSM 605]